MRRAAQAIGLAACVMGMTSAASADQLIVNGYGAEYEALIRENIIKPFEEKFGSNARPHIPLSSKVFTFALRSMNGVGSMTPFLMIRTTPFFCQTKSRPSGANARPTSVNGGTVATTSVAKPGSANVSADDDGALARASTAIAKSTTNPFTPTRRTIPR